MTFPEDIVEKAWARANGICECGRVSHEHHTDEDCEEKLIKTNRGREGTGCWETHHKDGNPDNNILSNCEIVCWPCHILITAAQSRRITPVLRRRIS